MQKQLEKLGYEVFGIMGTVKERKAKLKELKKMLVDGHSFKFLYSESSTIPNFFANKTFWPPDLLLEWHLYRLCAKNNIMSGLFYRDIHWRFNIFQRKGKLLQKLLITKVYPLFHRFDLWVYKPYLNVLFLPSIIMKQYLPELKHIDTYDLPPGLFPQEKIETVPSGDPFRITYVGGVGTIYNLKMILEVVSEYSAHQLKMTVCTRLKDWTDFKHEYEHFLASDNIEFVHKSGDELYELYKDTDIGCLFFKPITYHTFQMPLKLFEYASMHKPMIAIKEGLFGQFVEKENLGWAINYDRHELKSLLDDIVNKKVDASPEHFKKGFLKVEKESLWSERVSFIADVLTKKA